MHPASTAGLLVFAWGSLGTHVRRLLTDGYGLRVETQTSQEATSLSASSSPGFSFLHLCLWASPGLKLRRSDSSTELWQKVLRSSSGLPFLKLCPQVSGPTVSTGGEKQHRVSPSLRLLLIFHFQTFQLKSQEAWLSFSCFSVFINIP